MAMSTAAIDAKDLIIKKQRQTILKGLTFSVAPGKVTGLLGPSGSGKTTLMRTIVGAQKITSGAVNVLGEPAGKAKLRSRIGYVTQSPAIYLDLTVEQNLRYFAAVLRLDKKAVQKVLQETDLQDQRKQLGSTLSGGQRSRVSLAIALLGDPELLVLDEPTVGLDPVLRDHLWRLFRELASGGKTLLVSSHVMDEAARCDGLLLLRDGEIVAASSPDQLLKTTRTADLDKAFLKVILQHEKEQV